MLFAVFGIPNTTSAVSCKELNTPTKIKSFINKSYQSNPLLRKNVSLTLILDACEGKVCRSKSKRAAQKEILRIQKFEKKRRIFAEKGPNAPRCVIHRGGRQFVGPNLLPKEATIVESDKLAVGRLQEMADNLRAWHPAVTAADGDRQEVVVSHVKFLEDLALTL